MASIIIAQLLLLQTENSKSPIHMYINNNNDNNNINYNMEVWHKKIISVDIFKLC